MSLNHLELKEIRLRLGWSLAEMARRVGTERQMVQEWESNLSRPDPEMLRHYQAMQSHVNENSERVRQMPLAETALRDEHLQQISEDEVLRWEVEAREAKLQIESE
jgi:transcriptional regulator with XRE-family HTH domain